MGNSLIVFTCCFAAWWCQVFTPNPSVSILRSVGMLNTYWTEADSGPVSEQTTYVWIVCRDPKTQKACIRFTSWCKGNKVSVVLRFRWKLVSSALPPALPLPPASAGHLCARHLWNSAVAAHQLNSYHRLCYIQSKLFAGPSCTPAGTRCKQKQDKQILCLSLESASEPGGWKDSPRPWDSGGGSAFALPGAAGSWKQRTADKRSTRRVHLGCEATMTAPKLPRLLEPAV